MPMIRHLKRPNIVSVIAHWAAAWAMILALYFGLSAVYGNGPRGDEWRQRDRRLAGARRALGF
jgi:hypothetical protein